MSSTCKICIERSRRDLVNTSLLAGDRPSAIWKKYGSTLGVSVQSLYRHSRNHAPRTALSVRYVDGDTTSGEVISDLAGVRRSLVNSFHDATARGADAIARGAARELSNVSAVLLKEGIEDDTAELIRGGERLIAAVQRAARNRPQHATELALAAREVGDEETALDAEKLAAAATDYNKQKGEIR